MPCVCLHLSLENLGGVTPDSDTLIRTEKEWFELILKKRDVTCSSNSSLSASFYLTEPYLSKKHVLSFSYNTCAQVFPDEVSA